MGTEKFEIGTLVKSTSVGSLFGIIINKNECLYYYEDEYKSGGFAFLGHIVLLNLVDYDSEAILEMKYVEVIDRLIKVLKRDPLLASPNDKDDIVKAIKISISKTLPEDTTLFEELT